MSVRATYRLQFHKAFTFADAQALVPYFADLGISHLYASPILAARAGSMHGYDVIDHARINPELGGEDGFRALAAALRARGIGIILDIVPNHMAVGGADNLYWLDLLEKGRDSVFASLFDIDWEPAQQNLRDKVLVPFLGKPLSETLDAQEITFIWDEALGKFAFAYAEHRFPLRPEDYAYVLDGARDPAAVSLNKFNEPLELRALLAQQNFRVAYWRDAASRINWRRFFDITGLAALRIEDDAVFEMVHAAFFRLYGEGLIDGLRIDHIDGLADPRAYCLRLRARLEALAPQRERREPPYVVVEKILAQGEMLSGDWKVEGTTGYDFMNEVSGLQHDGANAARFGEIWASISHRPADFESEEFAARSETLRDAFVNALRAAAIAFGLLDEEIAQSAFQQALEALLKHFRAYRTYAMGDSPDPQPGPQFDAALELALHDANEEAADALLSIAATMRGENAAQGETARDAARRFNQLAAPVAAKAVEDTAFYRYGRILSRNDVGFAPGCFAIPREKFFAAMAERQALFPNAMLATATHDHKRGEDSRARLAALSEIPDEWDREVREWFGLNAPLRGAQVMPGDEYQLYQALLGCWPMEGGGTGGGMEGFTDRILEWRQKSLREAKLQTSWSAPDAAFEQQNADFVRAILDPEKSKVFLDRISAFVARLAPAGVLNSLVQTTLRYTCPGVPDLFQGTELWDLSLVDPDNRRPVDFDAHRHFLSQASVPSAENWQSGEVKLTLIARLLGLRAAMPECFAGGFRELPVHGPHAEHVLAFLREADGKAILIAVPRLCVTACIVQGLPNPDPAFWGETTLLLPPELRAIHWQNALRSEQDAVGTFDCAALFGAFPVAVLVSRAEETGAQD